MGKTVPKTEGTVFPNTDWPRMANDIFIFFLKPNEILHKMEPEWVQAVITARSTINLTIFKQVNGS